MSRCMKTTTSVATPDKGYLRRRRPWQWHWKYSTSTFANERTIRGEWIQVHQVLYVPGLQGNTLSIGRLAERHHIPIQLARSISTPRRRDAGVRQEGWKELRPLPAEHPWGANDSWPGRWRGQGSGHRPKRHQPGNGARCIYAMASTARARWRGEDVASSDQCAGNTCLGPRTTDL